MCLFKKLLQKKVELVPVVTPYIPVSNKTISGTDLEKFLKDKFPNASLWLSDREYILCHYDDVAYFLANNPVNRMIYEAEFMDCDDFAAALWGDFSRPPWSKLAIGYLWTEKHALNCVITEDMKLLFLEPQSDEMNEQLAAWQGTQPRLIIV